VTLLCASEHLKAAIPLTPITGVQSDTSQISAAAPSCQLSKYKDLLQKKKYQKSRSKTKNKQ